MSRSHEICGRVCLLGSLLLTSCTAPYDNETPPVPLPPPPPMQESLPWSLQFSSQSGATDYGGFDMDASGNVLVWIHGEQTMDFGTSTVTAVGSADWHLGKFNKKGELSWVRHFIADGITNIAATFGEGDPASIVVTIRTDSPMLLDGDVDMTVQPTTLALMKLDANGEVLYLQHFGVGESNFGPCQTRVRRDGHVFLALMLNNQTVDFTGTPISCGADWCTVLAEFDVDGTPIHARKVPGSVDTVNSISFGPADSLVVAGQFTNEIDFGDGPHPCTESMSPYVVKLPGIMDAPLWTNAYCGYEEQWANAAIFDDDGNVYFGGEGMPPLDLGGGSLETTSKGFAGFVAKLAPDGSHMWSRFLDEGLVNKIEFAPDGRLFVAGMFHNEALTGSQVYLYELDPTSGKSLAARRVLTSAGFAPFRLTAMSVQSDALMVGGSLVNDNSGMVSTPLLDFGAGPHFNRGNDDMVVAIVPP
ncbi:MAG TPA: hypothetical protein PK156_26920 [Polyangium sp.]|nr:hypothetical protein [Polyangium sp.]